MMLVKWRAVDASAPSLTSFAPSEAYEANDDLIAVGVDGIVAQGDAGVGCCLSCNRGVGRNVEALGQGYDACHVEDDGLACRAAFLEAIAQGTGIVLTVVLVVRERCYVIHIAFAPSSHVAPMALCTREGRYLCACSHGKSQGGKCDKKSVGHICFVNSF